MPGNTYTQLTSEEIYQIIGLPKVGHGQKRLYDELVAEHKRSFELSGQPGAMVGVVKDDHLATP